jgi:hypothetical protein
MENPLYNLAVDNKPWIQKMLKEKELLFDPTSLWERISADEIFVSLVAKVNLKYGSKARRILAE